MNFARRIAITLVATTLGVGVLGIAAPAQADTSWGCGGYCRVVLP